MMAVGIGDFLQLQMRRQIQGFSLLSKSPSGTPMIPSVKGGEGYLCIRPVSYTHLTLPTTPYV